MYQLAEALHLPVYKILDEMPTSEVYGWLDYYAIKAHENYIDEQKAKGNLMVMNEADILKSAGL